MLSQEQEVSSLGEDREVFVVLASRVYRKDHLCLSSTEGEPSKHSPTALILGKCKTMSNMDEVVL